MLKNTLRLENCIYEGGSGVCFSSPYKMIPEKSNPFIPELLLSHFNFLQEAKVLCFSCTSCSY